LDGAARKDVRHRTTGGGGLAAAAAAAAAGMRVLGKGKGQLLL
jgi:hypothetical protein